MGRFICELGGLYFEWSNVVDAPVTVGMDLDEFIKYYKETYGTSSMDEFYKRLRRVEQKGTSAIYSDLDELIQHNRAGKNESRLSKYEIYKLIRTGVSISPEKPTEPPPVILPEPPPTGKGGAR